MAFNKKINYYNNLLNVDYLNSSGVVVPDIWQDTMDRDNDLYQDELDNEIEYQDVY